MQRLRSQGAIQTAKRSVTRVIDQADDQNQLDPYARLEKQTLVRETKADLSRAHRDQSAYNGIRDGHAWSAISRTK